MVFKEVMGKNFILLEDVIVMKGMIFNNFFFGRVWWS